LQDEYQNLQPYLHSAKHSAENHETGNKS